MIANRPLSGKTGFRTWAVCEGRQIPEHILKTLDIETLKKAGAISEEKVPEIKEKKGDGKK